MTVGEKAREENATRWNNVSQTTFQVHLMCSTKAPALEFHLVSDVTLFFSSFWAVEGERESTSLEHSAVYSYTRRSSSIAVGPSEARIGYNFSTIPESGMGAEKGTGDEGVPFRV